MSYVIEDLRTDNAEDYAKVNILAWRQSYKGIVNDDFLDLLNTENKYKETVEKLIRNLNEDRNKAFILRVDEKPVGILRVRKSQFEDYPDYGQLGAIYLLDEVKGKGYGRILFNKAVEVLKDWGYTKMINGCFEGNPSNEFYKRMGGKFVGTTMLTLQNGQELVENLYCYDEI
ncbi:MAG: GNAT family N-acetyltransferase [Bacilli bacterium]|nr:GNAT family N-acetyltransferase [Bacilli bacterium]